MAEAPIFTVIIATWNRGRHIIPTLRSVLGQTLVDFELIVVGDGCTDETEQVLAPFLSDFVRWINLQQRGGSQSYPNNAGIAAARGKYVAYLGHDDIWAPDHLARLKAVFDRFPECSYAVSGGLLHGPPDSGVYLVSGLFDDPSAVFEHFFPPSTIAHLKSVGEDLGGWLPHTETKAAVDADFMLRAARAGCIFRSTGAITVHKFTASHRYLSYLRQSSEEQEECLSRMAAVDWSTFVDHAVACAQRQGTFMSLRHHDYEKRGKGELARDVRVSKGIDVPALQPLTGVVSIAQTGEWRGYDWHGLEGRAHGAFRWSGPSPVSRILIPFTSEGLAYVRIDVVHAIPGYFDDLAIEVNGVPVDWALLPAGRRAHQTIAFLASLKGADCSIISLRGRTATASSFGGNDDPRRVGVAVGSVRLKPVTASTSSWHSMLAKLWPKLRGYTSSRIGSHHGK